MEEANYIRENELLVNQMIQKLYKKIIWIPFILLGLYYVGIFQISGLCAYILTAINLVSILVIINAHKFVKNEEHIKWIILIGTTGCTGAVYGTAYANGMLLLMLPILVATLYFNKRLIKISFAFTFGGIIVGEVVASIFKLNYEADFGWIPIHLIFFLVQLAMLILVLLTLAERTSVMLRESNALNKEINGYLEKSKSDERVVRQAIETVEERIKETSIAATEVEHSIEEIALSSRNIVVSAQDTRSVIHKVSDIVHEVVEQAQITQDTNSELTNVTNQNKVHMGRFLKSMDMIKEKNDYSKDCMNELQSKIKVIGQVLEHITSIADQTELLALNANIEAARSGEMGKGFSVIADEVKKLAAESTSYGEKIKELTAMVTADVTKVSEAIKESDEAYYSCHQSFY
ncbi:MAG: hypothetical protein J6F30_17055 [Cellulosilyticum sp.]|nr:hypothetical protein [Cellulosilyticum sp.]